MSTVGRDCYIGFGWLSGFCLLLGMTTPLTGQGYLQRRINHLQEGDRAARQAAHAFVGVTTYGVGMAFKHPALVSLTFNVALEIQPLFDYGFSREEVLDSVLDLQQRIAPILVIEGWRRGKVWGVLTTLLVVGTWFITIPQTQ